MVESTSSRSSGKSHVTPTNREGRKLEVLGRKIYSLTTFVLFVVNYLTAMGAYQRQLWSRVLPALQVAPEENRQIFLNGHAEALTVSKHQRLASRHIADATAKILSSAITLRRHAWLRAANIVEDVKTRIENLPFDGTGLFNEKTDSNLEDLHKVKKDCHSLFHSTA